MREIIEAWQGKKALVMGDPLVDRYHFGRVDRVSQEAPVPVFVAERSEERRGGADNVAANLESLGLQVSTFFPFKPWITKTRFMVGHHQLFRIDNDYPYPAEFTHEYEETEFDVIVISDYAKGWCSEEKCRAVIEASKCPVVVDPKGSKWEKYLGATVICPNESEYQSWAGPVLRKRGAHGIDLCINGGVLNFPAQAKHVFDVTGAGDTVVATVAATLAAKGSLELAAMLANLAAGVVVGEVGTTVCALDSLMAALETHESNNQRGEKVERDSSPSVVFERIGDGVDRGPTNTRA